MNRRTNDRAQGSTTSNGTGTTRRARRPLAAMVATATVASGMAFTFSPVPIARAAVIVVTTTENSQVDGLCSLQEAIVNANNDASTWPDCFAGDGADVITFAIPGTGPFEIDITNSAGVPTITDTVDIDATTQPGHAGIPLVVIDIGSTDPAPAFDLSATTGSKVRGISIINSDSFSSLSGIIAGPEALITGNWIGVHPNGTVDGLEVGVEIDNVAGVELETNLISGNRTAVAVTGSGAEQLLVTINRIGTDTTGTTPIANRNGIVVDAGPALEPYPGLVISDNIISGNQTVTGTDGYGIRIDGGVEAPLIVGNLIGTNADGLGGIPNGIGIGIGIDDPVSSLDSVRAPIIGGGTPAEANLISGNDGAAIVLGPGSDGGNVIGNVIGLDNDSGRLPNNTAVLEQGPFVPAEGDIVVNGSSNHRIGSIANAEWNRIEAGGFASAVRVISGARNRISGNQIAVDAGIGIDIGDVGFTPNDSGDGDAPLEEGLEDPLFANNLQNSPVILAADLDANVLDVELSLDSLPIHTRYPVTFEVFAAQPGSGALLLGTVELPAPGTTTFERTNASAYGVVDGTSIFATAIDFRGNTSEYSDSAPVAGPGTIVVNDLGDQGDVFIDGFCERTAETGNCTLRAAIEEANATPAHDTIVFNFPSTDSLVFTPQSSLPTITSPLTIDGLSTPGASCASWPPTLRVVIDTSGARSGLSVDSQLTLRGVVLNGSPSVPLPGGGFGRGNLVYLEGSSTGSVFECNFFGTDLTGTQVVGRSQEQIWFNGSNGNRVGGPSPSQRNLFAGDAFEHLWMPVSDDNEIYGNYFGTDVSGTQRLGSVSGPAIFVGGAGNQIGGATPGAGNLIAFRASTAWAIEIYDSGNGATGNTIRGNSIHSNAGLGIDLIRLGEPSGVTFNHLGPLPSTAPNDFQNYPVLSVATSDQTITRVAGTLDSRPGDYLIDVYANTECDATSFGEGERYLGAFPVTIGATGSVDFDSSDSAAVIAGGVAEPDGITVTATEVATGNTSEFSFCRPVSTTNTNWVQAQTLSSGTFVSQFITSPLQEKWFRVPAGPGADVSVQLTSQPGFAVSLHSDPLEAYNTAIIPNSAVALAAQAADVAFLPSGSLPSGSLPSGSLPSGSLPSGSLPSGSLEIGFLPSGSLPSGSLPSGSLPSGSLPSGSLPSGSLPSGSLPSGSLPSGSLPSGSLPSGSLEAYGTASVRSLVAWSANPYATTQTIERNTFDRSGDAYIRVVGPFDLDDQFGLTVTVTGGVCSALLPITQVDYQTPPDTDRSTVILTDSDRLVGTAAEVAAAIADLTRFAARSDVNGVVIDLADPIYADVAAANAQADALPNCAFAKNVVAEEIKDIVDEFRIANPIEYVVIAGGADVVPFHQVSDVAGLANEREYIAPAAPNSPTEAGLRSGLVKGQDFYGSSIDLTIAGRTLAVPDLAVGRLVDGATDISFAIEAYEATDGTVVPSSSLVTGYDFVGDAAATIADDFAAGLGTQPTRLIQAVGEFPSAPTAWTADQLRTPLLSGANDVVMLTGHFSAGKLLAADYRTTLLASEVQDGANDFTDAIILALGCHGGFSLPSTDLIAGASPDPDWAKAFLRRGAASFVAATGYAYGDTELEEYGERLFIELARQMRTGTGPVSMGEALVLAKQAYLEQVPQLAGIDEKTIVEMTLYGLPMMKVDVPGERLPRPTSSSIVGDTSPVGGTATPGLTTATIEIAPQLGTTRIVDLADLENGGTVRTQYTPGADGVVAIPFEPVFPKQLDDVSSPGRVLRGVAIRGGLYADVANIVPFTSAPTTETSRPIQSFQSDVFYPNQVWAPNFYGAINPGSTGPTRLVTVPQQYRSSSVGSISGTVRTWTQMAYQLYYLPDTWNTGDPAIIEAGVSAAPSITGASADVSGDVVTFSVNAVAEGSAGVQSVWVLYTGEPGSPFFGEWLPVDLVRDAVDPTVWTGTLALQGADASLLRFMVQAVGGAGLTTLATNLGRFYRVGVDNAPPVNTPPTTTFLTGPASGQRGAPQTFQATVLAGPSPVIGGVVDFEIAGQRVQAVTNGSGVANITITPFAEPGTYEALATLRGSSDRRPSSDQSTFTVTLTDTTLRLSPQTSTASTLGSSGLIASLDSAEGGLGGKPVVFTLVSGTTVSERVIITDAWGEAALGDTGLPPGTYTVTASFGGAADVDAPDPFFAGSTSGSATLVLQDLTAPTITARATVAGGAPYTAGTWTTSDVTVTFTCADRGGAGLTSCTTPQTVSTPGVTTAVTGTAVDGTGLTTTASFGPVQIDRTGPTITVTTPAAAATYPVGSVVNAAYTCADAESGLATCAGTVAVGAPIDTATVGPKTFVVTATDVLGNTSTTTVNYTVGGGNLAPTVVADMGVAGLQEIGFRGNAVLITGTFADPDGRAPYRASVRWTTGASFTPFVITADGRFAAAWIYGGAGTRTVTVRICDAQGLCGTDNITVRTGISQRVSPVVQCVTDRGASTFLRYRATFGYNNPAPFAIAAPTLPLVENTFLPLPAFRGQPQVFLPGNQRNVFTADFRSGTLNWTLHGTTAIARTTSPRC